MEFVDNFIVLQRVIFYFTFQLPFFGKNQLFITVSDFKGLNSFQQPVENYVENFT
ncbi:MAG: hypothetical protein RR198_01365 [Oscillospiraceae bacterium]